MKRAKLLCVRCGKAASEGSMKEPYCKACFRKRFRGYGDYLLYLVRKGK